MSKYAGRFSSWQFLLGTTALTGLGIILLLYAPTALAGISPHITGKADADKPTSDLRPVYSSVAPLTAHDLNNISDRPADILVDKYNNIWTDAITSQDFEPALDAYDAQAASIFTVPPGETWSVDQVDVAGIYNSAGIADAVNVYIYTDTISTPGSPGSPVLTQTNVVPIAGLETGNFEIPIDPPATLASGRYWISVQAKQELATSGQWFWRNRRATIKAFAQWRNPLDGFHRNGCIDWNERWRCQGTLSDAFDQVYRLLGVSNGTPTPTPTGTLPTATATRTPRPQPPTATGTPPTPPPPLLTLVRPVDTDTPVPPTATPTSTPTPDPCSIRGIRVTTPNFNSSGNQLVGVDLWSPDNIWAVGQHGNDVTGYRETLIEHWNGSTWSIVPSPSRPNQHNWLDAVQIISPDDIWAVGYNGSTYEGRSLTMHWDGATWSIVASPNPGTTSTLLLGVAGLSSNDVWAVGEYSNPGGDIHTLALRWNGSQWNQVPTPNVSGFFDSLADVTAITPNDMWAVGSYRGPAPTYHLLTLTQHWDGVQWSAIASPNISEDQTQQLYAVSASASDNVWAVGYYHNNQTGMTLSVTMRFDGTSWIIVPAPGYAATVTGATGVKALSASEVWLIGGAEFGAIANRWDGNSWSDVPIYDPNRNSTFLNGVVASSAQDIWAVGSVGDNGNVVTDAVHFAPGCTTPSPTASASSTHTPTQNPTLTGTATTTRTPTYVSTAVTTATATLSVANTPTPCLLAFADVPPGSTFYDYIRCLSCRGIINGYSNGTFRPNNNVTRGQLAKIVANSAGYSDPQNSQLFQDVPGSSTFFDYIGRLASRGYMSGYQCGGPGEPCVLPDNLPYFRANNNATRGQISKIVSNTAGYAEAQPTQLFEDVALNSTFQIYIGRLASRGYMSGYPCGGPDEPCNPPGNLPYFRPNNNATRGQTSKIVSNTFFPGCNPHGR